MVLVLGVLAVGIGGALAFFGGIDGLRQHLKEKEAVAGDNAQARTRDRERQERQLRVQCLELSATTNALSTSDLGAKLLAKVHSMDTCLALVPELPVTCSESEVTVLYTLYFKGGIVGTRYALSFGVKMTRTGAVTATLITDNHLAPAKDARVFEEFFSDRARAIFIDADSNWVKVKALVDQYEAAERARDRAALDKAQGDLNRLVSEWAHRTTAAIGEARALVPR